MNIQGKLNLSDPAFLRQLDEAWEKEPCPELPFLKREAEAFATLPPEEQKVWRQAWENVRGKNAAYVQLRQRLHEKNMTAGDVQRMLGINRAQLTDWGSRQVRAWAQARHDLGWRHYSIIDSIKLQIIKTIKSAGVPINRFGRPLTNWIQEASIVDGLIIPFSLGRRIFIAVELRHGGLGYYWDESHPEGVQRLNSAEALVICLPLNEVCASILRTIKHKDFEARQAKDGIWSFRIGGQWLDFKHLAHCFEPKQNIAAGMRA